ncbi:hypothetical protein K470DRAFT_49459 [Piedraia hortae CBS 480.64]|uniref:Cryptic loci regulator 2 N-terminal domain-containing protein n=1 Tax=Piedraia hortae CBS 480.64 TaxID=1314780 RepID=A0A6A7C9R7_9PEZI|nr:hypothetical protein K470DRAFT_49459 [Piedraia hortae CBS 480.64]
MATAVLCVKPFSDADEVNNHPRKARGPTIEWTKNDDFWTRRIGQRWAKHLGLDPPFEEYRLDNLPTGYAGYVRPKIYGDPSSVRLNYLYGHPSGSRYNSGESFWPHFVWLQEGMEGECECKLCGKGKSKKSTPMVWEEGQDEEDAIDDEEEEVGEGVIPINSFSDGD